MTFRPSLAAVLICGLALAGSSIAPNAGYAQDDDYSFDDFMAEIEKDKKDQKRCRNARGDVPAAEAEEACTRLIETAPHENDLVGEYYVDRAMARTDAEERCADVRKGIAIIKGSKSTIYGQDFIDAAGRLEAAVCQ